MKLPQYTFVFLVTLAFLSCSSDRAATENEENPSVNVLPPSHALTIFPENNSECNEGQILDDQRSRVIFRWTEAENTDSYRITITNLNNGETLNINATTNETPINLDRGRPYEWYVTSLSNATEQIAISETSRFYNQGPGIENYAPFPPNAEAPKIGEIVTTDQEGNINLEWSSNDIDDDIIGYELFLDIDNPPTNTLGQQMENIKTVMVEPNTTYYWKVIAIDQHGNSSNSQVFQFKTAM